MIKSFSDLEKRISLNAPVKLCIAGATDKDLLLAVQIAQQKGYITPILVGKTHEIEAITQEISMHDYSIIEPQHERNAAEEAAFLIKNGEADILMKGVVDTTAYMRAILSKDHGLRGDSLISALAIYEVPQYHKLIFGSDSGINVAPDAEQKKIILRSALNVMHKFGYENPKVAILAASEVVNKNVQATVDAVDLVESATKGEFGNCTVEGPLALDVIFDPMAAKHKNISSKITGEVDLLLFPNMETGNVLGKSWLHFCKAKWGGLVLGCTKPIILGSRSDTAEVKINSIILGCLAAQS